MTDWVLDGLTAGLVLAAFLPYLIHPSIPAASKDRGSTKRVWRFTVPRRYPVRSASGAILLTQKQAIAIQGEEAFGRFLNRAGAIFGLGMMFMLWELAFGGANIIQLSGYGYYAVSINYAPLIALIAAPFVVEILGAVIVADARRRMRAPGWDVVLGEAAALRGIRPTRRHAVLSEEERELMEQLGEGEEAGSIR